MRRSVVLVALIFLLAVVGLFIGFRDLQDLADGRRVQVTSREPGATVPEERAAPPRASPQAGSDAAVAQRSDPATTGDRTASDPVQGPSSGEAGDGDGRGRNGGETRRLAADESPVAAGGEAPVLEPLVLDDGAGEEAGAAPARVPREVQEAARRPERDAATPEAAASLTEEVVPDPARPETMGPSFDIVRVEPSGETVVAGRAGPGSRVSLFDRGERVGGATADAQGQWVIVLDLALAPGAHELSIEARDKEDNLFISPNVVIVSVPEPAPVQTASAPAREASGLDGAVERAAEADVANVTAAQERGAEAAAGVAGPAEATQPAAPRTSAPSTDPSLQREAVSALSASDAARPADAPRPLAVLVPRTGGGAAQILQHPEVPSGGTAPDALRLATVNYDEEGAAVIGGRAPAGALVLLYLNGEKLARATADREGRWSARLDRPIGRGVHELRVDQLDDSGRVVAQVRSPFARAEIVAGVPDETAVVVQPGNSLWRIARRIYGEGVRYTVIYDANKDAIVDPDLIYPGQIFTVPTAN